MAQSGDGECNNSVSEQEETKKKRKKERKREKKVARRKSSWQLVFRVGTQLTGGRKQQCMLASCVGSDRPSLLHSAAGDRILAKQRATLSYRRGYCYPNGMHDAAHESWSRAILAWESG